MLIAVFAVPNNVFVIFFCPGFDRFLALAARLTARPGRFLGRPGFTVGFVAQRRLQAVVGEVSMSVLMVFRSPDAHFNGAGNARKLPATHSLG